MIVRHQDCGLIGIAIANTIVGFLLTASFIILENARLAGYRVHGQACFQIAFPLSLVLPVTCVVRLFGRGSADKKAVAAASLIVPLGALLWLLCNAQW